MLLSFHFERINDNKYESGILANMNANTRSLMERKQSGDPNEHN